MRREGVALAHKTHEEERTERRVTSDGYCILGLYLLGHYFPQESSSGLETSSYKQWVQTKKKKKEKKRKKSTVIMLFW